MLLIVALPFLLLVVVFLVITLTKKAPASLQPVSVTPESNASGVSIYPRVGVFFSRAVSNNEAKNISLTISPTAYGSILWTTDKKEIYFQPTLHLNPSQTYTATFTFLNRSYSWSFTTVSVDNVSKNDQIRAQGESDYQTAQQQKIFYQKYPWYNSIPPKNNDYFILFDNTTNSFTILIYTKQGSTVPIQTQINNIKQEALQALTNIGVNTKNFSFNWIVTPQ